MTGDDWIRVPVGQDAERFTSIGVDRRVLVVARTVTSTSWLLDFLDELIGDARIQVLFTVDDDAPSAYHRAARELLRALGAPTIPWSQAVTLRFDLAISSSFNGNLSALKAPLFLTLHGPGLGKVSSLLPAGDVPVTEASWSRAGRTSVARTTVAVSHVEQAAAFAVRGRDVDVLVAGDPCLDRLRISIPLRDRYREWLGVGSRQRILLLASTWGSGSQFASDPDLSMRFVVELPLDEWKVAMILHPNIWYGHGVWQVRAWLRRAEEAGVLLVPPDGDEWRALLIASDVVVGDHGSVVLYAISIGRPVVLSAFAHDELLPDVPLEALGRRAPMLDGRSTLASQIDTVLADHDPTVFGDLVDRLSDVPARSTATMRQRVYEILELAVPGDVGATRSVSPPTVHFAPHSACLVYAQLEIADADGLPVVTLRRFPAGATDATPLLHRECATWRWRTRAPCRSGSTARRSSCGGRTHEAPPSASVGRGPSVRSSISRGATPWPLWARFGPTSSGDLARWCGRRFASKTQPSSTSVSFRRSSTRSTSAATT
jgi:hypothetical protein